MIASASSPAAASGVGFAEEPEPDEFTLPRPAVTRYTLAVGSHLCVPRGEATEYLRSSVGIDARGARWLSPRFGLVAAISFTGLRLDPLIPDSVQLSQYMLAVGARTATAWSRRVGLHGEILIARHSLRVRQGSRVWASHSAAMVFGAGGQIRVARDLLIEATGRLLQVDTSLDAERRLPLKQLSIEISVTYEL
jgi:hypothetical protein